MTEPISFATGEGPRLEGEIRRAVTLARARAVLCHPHPQHGGTMRSIVVGALFDALPEAGVTCLRFNFRGVEGSGGAYDDGVGEQHDVVAALDALDDFDPAGRDHLPVLLAGWSFGADMALATPDPRIRAWLAVAPPLRFASPDAVARETRSKLLVLAQHDQFRSPDEVVAVASSWVNTRVEIVGGADHFFVGRTARLAEVAVAFVAEL